MGTSNFQMTHHALTRLKERSRLDANTFEAIFNGNFVIKVGACRKPGKSHLAHRMFFSPVDRSFFVAIQDLLNGDVITVLTFEQYRDRHPAISIGSRALQQVNRMVVEGLAPPSCWEERVKGARTLVYADFGADIRQASLGAFRTVLISPDLERLGGMPRFWRWIAERCETLELPLDRIHRVTARLPYGDAQEIHYLCA